MEKVNEINFPNEKLSPLPANTPPNYFSIKKWEKQICTNVVSIHSQRGGGNYGHLGLIIIPQQYQQLSLIPFVPAQYPGRFIEYPPGARKWSKPYSRTTGRKK